MKKIVLSTIAMAAMVLTSYGQGIITFDASEGGGGVVSQGTAGNLEQNDINASLLYFNGTSYVDIVDMLLSDNTATSGLTVTVPPTSTQAAGGDITFSGPGILYDNSGNNYVINGIASGTVVSFEVEAWTGSFNSYAAALASGTAFAGTSSPFSETLSPAGAPQNANIDSMPNFTMTVPEPTTLAFAGLGGLSLLLFRRRS
ncbi:MAG TPA: PEP-CTERM sorting domain-containing protein [Verrucomicrobiae bacterium]|jgi:hypothetical protein